MAGAKPAALSLEEVDLRAKDNNAKHHTDELSQSELIVRRGQSFSLALRFKSEPKVQRLVFIASTGACPNENKGTKCVFGISDSGTRGTEAQTEWRAELDQKESKKERVVVKMTPPANAPIGKYSLSLKQSALDTELGTLALLFNPWCPDDSVYMEKEPERQEYVMNESGVIFVGSSKHIGDFYWDYGQFEDDMVEICLRLLDVSPKHLKDPGTDDSCQRDPIYVSRVISAMINSAGDKGVLTGRWNGDYEGGYDPCHWSGSHPILSRWYKGGCKAVKYGQCWVFAGVMCSVMRLLGIPCRVVTNFQSAHDCNKNLTIDEYHSLGDDDVHSDDSVWNFHVWVEAWMKRPDLSPGYDGWQVVDPTPQELSGGVYCCGPAPVTAILKGQTNLKYDVPFVFAEVNADRVDWLVLGDNVKFEMGRPDDDPIGQNISTKCVGSDKRLDITNKYKYEEGSDMERSVFKYAVLLNNNGRDLAESFLSTTDGAGDGDGLDSIDNSAANVITVERLETPARDSKICMTFKEVSKPLKGKDVKLKLVLTSEAREPRNVTINIRVKAKTYSGCNRSEILTEVKEKVLRPGKELAVPVVIRFAQYWKALMNYDAMTVTAIVSDNRDPSEAYLAVDEVVLKDPPLEAKALNEAQVNEPLYVEMAFTNPVAETLKKCCITVSGTGLLKDEVDISLPDLDPGKRVRVKVYLYPYKPKQRTLAVDFSCSVFRDVKATLPVLVQAKRTQGKVF